MKLKIGNMFPCMNHDLIIFFYLLTIKLFYPGDWWLHTIFYVFWKISFNTKIIHDTSLENGNATYDILVLTANYDMGNKLLFNMTSFLKEKLPRLGFYIKKQNDKIKLPWSRDI